MVGVELANLLQIALGLGEDSLDLVGVLDGELTGLLVGELVLQVDSLRVQADTCLVGSGNVGGVELEGLLVALHSLVELTRQTESLALIGVAELVLGVLGNLCLSPLQQLFIITALKVVVANPS